MEDMLSHPRHLAAEQQLAELITVLRGCCNVKDGYEFHQELLRLVLEAERDRLALKGSSETGA